MRCFTNEIIMIKLKEWSVNYGGVLKFIVFFGNNHFIFYFTNQYFKTHKK